MPSESTTFRFRIKFQLEPGRSIKDLEGPTCIELANVGKCELKPSSAADAAEGQTLIITGPRVSSVDLAKTLGSTALGALLGTSLKQGFGVLLQTPRPGGVITDYGMKYAFELFPDNDTLYRDRLGLTVFEEKGKTAFVDVGQPGILVSSEIGALLDAWGHESSGYPSVRKLIAYDLHASSRFERSARTRFLLLVMAVEALAEQKSRPESELALVEQMKKSVETAALDKEAKDALIGGLSSLLRVSIGRACADLISTGITAGVIGDSDGVAFFRECYRLRGKIVHAGVAPDVLQLVGFANRLEPTVRALLDWKLKSEAADPALLWNSTFTKVVDLRQAAFPDHSD